MVLLGAGASVDAGYPMAADLLARFQVELDAAAEHDEVVRERTAQAVEQMIAKASSDPDTIVIPVFDPVAAQSAPSIVDVFRDLWTRYETAARGVPGLAAPAEPDGHSSAVTRTRTGVSFASFSFPQYTSAPSSAPHLEGLFSYYDRLLDPEFLTALEMSAGQALNAATYLRRLRDIAVEMAYKELGATAERQADYLAALATIPGPGNGPAVIATLNFDLALEQVLSTTGVAYDDGFGPVEAQINPLADDGDNPEKLWMRATHNMDRYRGFAEPRDTLRLLKLHGSLGWYVLEEGSGDIGWPPALRRNVSYAAFRLRPELLWQLTDSVTAQSMANGGPGDPALAGPDEITRKAGAIWLRPLLEYAKSIKTHPSVISTELMNQFLALTDTARTIIVIGYSWGDVHITDALLEAVARGARLRPPVVDRRVPF